MKPFKDEIVKGTDKGGGPFQEGRVLDSNNNSSRIELPDGRHVIANHDDIRGQVDTPGNQ